ncbi:MAG: STAS domain-containing protein [Alphaproteobacteria bacterium]
MSLRVTSSSSGDQLLLHLNGEMDSHTCDQVPTILAGLLGDVAPTAILIDASRLRFVDSSGLSALLRCHRMAADRNASFVMNGPTPAVRRVLEITGLDELLGRSGSEDGRAASPGA